MDSYDRLICVIKGNVPDRIPCCNFASTITKEFMNTYGCNWIDVNKDPEKMAKVASAAHELCGLDTINLPFDLSVEAEVLGVGIEYRVDGSPIVRRYLTDEDYYMISVPYDIESRGRLPIIKKALQILKKEYEGKVPINVILPSPITTVSMYMLGPSMMNLAMRRMPGVVKAMIKEIHRLHVEVVRLYEEWGADIISIHDPKASPDVLNPGFYDSLVAEYHKMMIEETKLPVAINVCGNIIQVLEKIVECNPSIIVFDYKTPVKYVKNTLRYMNRKISIAGNLSPFWDICFADIYRMDSKVAELIESGVDIVSPGCDLWIATPIEKLTDLVRLVEKYSKRLKS